MYKDLSSNLSLESNVVQKPQPTKITLFYRYRYTDWIQEQASILTWKREKDWKDEILIEQQTLI